jgi:hypothetical protein
MRNTAAELIVSFLLRFIKLTNFDIFDFEKGNLLLEVLVVAAFFVELFTEKSVVFLEGVHRSLEVFEMSVEKMLGLLLFQEKALLVIEF